MKKTNLFEKFNKVFYALLIMTAVSFTFTACDGGDDDPTPTPTEPVVTETALDIVVASETHTQMEKYLNLYPELTTILNDTTKNVTLFAPNDAAFVKLQTILGVSSLDVVSSDVIKSVLSFHVHTSGAILRADIDASTSLSTVQGEAITINEATGNIKTGGSDDNVEFIGDEIKAKNGVVHVVETILVPPMLFAGIAENLGKVSQPVLLGADFTTLAAAIAKADTYAEANANVTKLATILADPARTLTVFAPVNAVFAQAQITLDTYSAQQWYGIIANHVLAVELTAADIEAGKGYVALGGGTLTVLTLSAPTNPELGITSGVALDMNGIPGADAQVALADAFDSDINGVVHALAGVLSPVSMWGVTGTGVRGADNAALEWSSTVSLTALGSGKFQVSDITFGGYQAAYTDGDANPGQMTLKSDLSVEIVDVPDTVYGDDLFNGTGAFASGGFNISVSNTFGDSFDAKLASSTMGRGVKNLGKTTSNANKVSKSK